MASREDERVESREGALANLMALQAAAFELLGMQPGDDEARALQLLAEVESRCATLTDQARLVPFDVARRVSRHLEVVQAATQPEEGLSGARVRDACMSIEGAFTLNELAALMDENPKDVKRYLEPIVLSGRVVDTGRRYRRAVVYEWVGSAPVDETVERKRGMPEWREPPAGTMAPPNRGEPVRIRTERKDRKARSTPGARQKVINSERNWQRLIDAQQKRAAEQRAREQARAQAPGKRKKK